LEGDTTISTATSVLIWVSHCPLIKERRHDWDSGADVGILVRLGGCGHVACAESLIGTKAGPRAVAGGLAQRRKSFRGTLLALRLWHHPACLYLLGREHHDTDQTSEESRGE
jgi:hypothetical protein